MGALYGVYDMDGMFILYDIRLTRAVARINKCIFSYLYCCVGVIGYLNQTEVRKLMTLSYPLLT